MKKYFILLFFLLLFYFPKITHAGVVLDTTYDPVSNNYCLDDDGNNIHCILYAYRFDTGQGYPIHSTGKLESITLKVDLIGFPLFEPEYANRYVGIRIDGSKTFFHRCYSRDMTYGEIYARNNSWVEVTFYCDPNDTINFAEEKLGVIYANEVSHLHFALTTHDLITPTTPPYGNCLTDYASEYYHEPPITDRDLWMKITDTPQQPAKNPVLLIPGIMGTEIYKGSEKLWPDVNRMFYSSSDDFLNPLSLNDGGVPIYTDVVLGDIVGKPNTLFDYSQGLINDLKSQSYTENQTLFTFPYDWRKELGSVANNELKNKIDEVLNTASSAKVDVIAHSQGGLLIKKLLYDHPEYQEKINKIIFVGVPNLGAPKAAKALLYGDSMDISFLGMGLNPEEIKFLAHNMPSVYELLPSGEYFNHSGGYLGAAQPAWVSLLDTGNVFNYEATNQYLTAQNLNNNLIVQAANFHQPDYDNLSFSGSGIKTYNIVGCQQPSLSAVLDRGKESPLLRYGPGDGTVPVFSASNIPGATTFYALNSNHGEMLSQEGIRQQIVSLIAGSGLPAQNGITAVQTDCRFNGRQISVHSPVNMHIYDESQNHVGLDSEGQMEINIPGVQFDAVGHDQYAFLPEGHSYTVKLAAIGSGSFDFYSTIIQDSREAGTAFYHNIPVASSSLAEIALNAENDQKILLDASGDGEAKTEYGPSASLDSEQMLDITAPETTVSLSGQAGKENYFRSNVSVTLSAEDPVVSGRASQASGVLETEYSLDSGPGFQVYAAGSPIVVGSEGKHKIEYYSVDKAGNREETKTLEFVIDKTAPEAVMQFNYDAKDLIVSGQDSLSLPVDAVDSGNSVTLSDQAGNVTIIKFKENDRKRALSAEIAAITYNGRPADISKNKLAFSWSLDKQGNLKLLSQDARSIKDFNVSAVYNGKQTIIKGRDETGKINIKFGYPVFLKVFTRQGSLGWQY
ncbi:MAG: hypothetical protein M1383_04820 [Patescibacteria group bacterium]|nr:hypothetical protein [Patescibacteria group bacterium]